MIQRQKPGGGGLRSALDFVMAIIWILFGSFIIFSEQMTGQDFFRDSPLLKGGMKWVIGILFILYGFSRAYRGYTSAKKQNDEE